MCRIGSLLIRIDCLRSVTTVDRCCGERGIKECNVEVIYPPSSCVRESVNRVARESIRSGAEEESSVI